MLLSNLWLYILFNLSNQSRWQRSEFTPELRMGKLETRVAPEIKMRGKRKRLMRVFQTTRTILQLSCQDRKSKSKKEKKSSRGQRSSNRKISRNSSTSSSSSSSTLSSNLELSSDDGRREVNLNLRNLKQAIWTKLCFMYRLRRKNTSTTPLKNCWLKYADHYLKKFIQDKELKDSILTENPAPTKFMKVLSLDVFT